MDLWLPIELAAPKGAGLQPAACFGCLSKLSRQRLRRMRRVASTSDVDEAMGLNAGPNVMETTYTGDPKRHDKPIKAFCKTPRPTSTLNPIVLVKVLFW